MMWPAALPALAHVFPSGYTANNLTSFNSNTTLATDGAGRLARVIISSGGTPTTSSRAFRYNGPYLLAEYGATSGDNTTLYHRYVPGPGTDETLVWYNGSGTTDRRWLIADERGSTTAVTNASGSALAINTYDEYGVPGSSNLGRVQYTGQLWMVEDGLYHDKARAYSPLFGRFMQTDPAGYKDNLNWYAYVGDDPINLADATGNDSIAIHFRDQPIHLGNWTIPQVFSGGHSGVVIINDKTGATTYREFGRYDGSSGKIRGQSIPDLVMKDGVPTTQSVTVLLKSVIQIGARAKSSDISITYSAGTDAQPMSNYQDQVAKDKPAWSWPGGMNCHNFCSGTEKAGGNPGEQATSSLTSDNATAVAAKIVEAATRQCAHDDEQGGCPTK